MRTAQINRKTAETDISLTLNIDGRGECSVSSGCGFLDHMITLFAKHGRFDINLTCNGDMYVDAHHTVEDTGIALGKAFSRALSDKKGIVRYGNMIMPMDEALILSAVDCSGRSHLSFDAQMPSQKVGDFDTELAEEFFLAFVRNAECTLHIRLLDGKNSHHIIEGMFKSCARSFKQAVAIDSDFADEIPSTKGVL